MHNLIDIMFAINIIFVIYIVFFERRNPTATLTWLLVLVFIPVLGFLLYLFLGQDLRKKKMFYLKKEEESKILPILKQQDDSLQKHLLHFNNIQTDKYRDLVHLHLFSDQALFTQDNYLEIFTDGAALFNRIFSSLKAAKKFIHVQYYVIRNDRLGQEFVDILAEKARQGIEVKLLYDGMGCIRLPGNFFKNLQEAGGEVADFFPPFLPYYNLRINYRNHRKLCIIDGEESYIGGFNIGEEYLGLARKFGYWRDTHLLVKGKAIDGMEIRFFLDWRYASGQSMVISSAYFPERAPQGKSEVQIVSSGPDSKWASIRNGYLKLINKAQKRIYMQTPYFIPDESILEALKIAGLCGVDVRLMIPRKKDHLFVHWASLAYVGELLEAGVKCYYYEKGFLHSKFIVCDGFACSVGTANLDIRSFRLNFEVNAFIYDDEIACQLETSFIDDLADCHEITLDWYKKRPLSVRFKEAFSRLLSPIL